MNQLGSSGNRPPEVAQRTVGLARYGSAPGSLISSIAESVISGAGNFSSAGSTDMSAAASSFFSGDSPCLTSESSCRATSGASPDLDGSMSRFGGYRGSFPPPEYGGFGGIAGGSHLIRHSSSPAGFFSNILVDSGISPKGTENCSQIGTDGNHLTKKRLSSQWSFSQQDSLSQISEISIADIGENVSHGNSANDSSGNISYSYISGNIPLSSWDGPNSIAFTAPPNKCCKDNNGDVITSFNSLESQLSLPCTSMEIEAVEKYLHMQQDPIYCKLRAKRGCATHPRSIAERERRTRISKRLRKLQELVPNMDKQTNTSDMLDLAWQYIRELQSQIQKLNQEQAECTCTVKQAGI